jgi:hypothetical protein
LTANIKTQQQVNVTMTTPTEWTLVKQSAGCTALIYTVLVPSSFHNLQYWHAAIAFPSTKWVELNILICIMISSKMNVQQWMNTTLFPL